MYKSPYSICRGKAIMQLMCIMESSGIAGLHLLYHRLYFDLLEPNFSQIFRHFIFFFKGNNGRVVELNCILIFISILTVITYAPPIILIYNVS